MLFSLIAETEPCYVAQVGLKFTGIYLLLPPQCQGSFYFFCCEMGLYVFRLVFNSFMAKDDLEFLFLRTGI